VATAANISASASATGDSRPLRVLYADDMKELRDLIAIVLSRDGHQVETVEDGSLAWEKISADPHAYDLLITDHHMPRMNGLDLVQQVRASAFSGKVMVFSSELSPTVHASYRRLAVDHVMLKPVFPHTLRGALRDLFTARPI
jgi:two-component system chemotaxis response regulator CheY